MFLFLSPTDTPNKLILYKWSRAMLGWSLLWRYQWAISAWINSKSTAWAVLRTSSSKVYFIMLGDRLFNIATYIAYVLCDMKYLIKTRLLSTFWNATKHVFSWGGTLRTLTVYIRKYPTMESKFSLYQIPKSYIESKFALYQYF